MKKIITLLTFIPCFCFGQWTQLGANINGSQENDMLGNTNSIAIDSIGNTMAVGSAFNSNVFPFSGYARVLDWDGVSWVQRGNDFVGTDSIYEGTGSAVDLSANGLTVAVSSPWGYNSLGYKCGNLRVFDWSGGSWIQRGAVIEGEGNISPILSSDVFGFALELSSDGNYIAVGAKGNFNEVSFEVGHVRIYHWDGMTWQQIGQDIDGPNSNQTGTEFGDAVSINSAGNRVAIGGRFYKSSQDLEEQGIACVYEWNGSTWAMMGDTLFGGASGALLGSAVQLSSDGNSMAVGAPGANGSLGLTRVFDWDGVDWILRGAAIPGVSNSTSAESGTSLDLSYDGNRLAIGEPRANFSAGATRIFQWNGSSWQQIGATLSDGTGFQAFGDAVRINASGSSVTIGSPFNDDAGLNTGKVQVFENSALVSVSELNSLNQIGVYPNPVNDFININLNKDQLSKIELYSMTGSLLFKTELNAPAYTLNITNYPSGTYLVKVYNQNNDAINTRIIKK